MANYDNSANMAIELSFTFIKERMKEKGITESQLATTIGVNRSTLHRNFKRENPMALDTYFKICGALQLRPYLIPAEIDKTEMQRMFFN